MREKFLKIKKNLIYFLCGFLLAAFMLPSLPNLSINLFSQDQKIIALSQNLNRENINSPLGINLNGIAYWSSQQPFLDYFKSSRQWITQCAKADPDCRGEWNTKEEELLDLDENGWVKSLPSPEDSPEYTRVSTVFMKGTKGIPNQFVGGKYIVLYEGEGKISYGLSAKQDEAASTPGRDVIDVDASKSNGILITILETDPNKTGNYIKNIRVIKAENESLYRSGGIFNPEFIEKINKFRSLRFMDWMGTNHSQQKEWKDRPTPDMATYTLKGVPLEVMVALANQVQADPWFNMPHMATDEYMANFAQSVKKSLDPNLNVYVEFSNEVWNWNFQQTHYALKQGQKRWGEDKGDAFRQWYGMRSAQMCEIWKGTFGNEKGRVVCVMGAHTNAKGSETKVLDCPYWVAEGNKPCYQHGIDAYAITGYFSGALGQPENASTVESWLKDRDEGMKKAFKQLRKGGLLPDDRDSLMDNYEKFVYHSNIAKERGLQLVAYEGGQHIVGRKDVVNNEKLTNFFIEINRHPQMYELYTQLFKDWKEVGGTMFMHFVDVGKPTKWGSWGALEYVDQSESPKYSALMDFITQNSCWWEGC
ncbi:putative cellulose-binding domain protein [Lyngbya aestuarii BL J]|uniref:Putative cellulose-binding domain protein n=1 Tax=Lyngbya aestuarii BL J TaxID=1348334 RepID=U7QPB6_9CYAN|nr:hypothetical protein [Lyngbya aestuarii]ERT09117.1 putative cellulose-binding domain protein [Lyngbya aestuarii BL J]